MIELFMAMATKQAPRNSQKPAEQTHGRPVAHHEDIQIRGTENQVLLQQRNENLAAQTEKTLEDQMTLKSRGPVPIYYESLYGI